MMETIEKKELFHTTNLKVAAALLTLGFEFHKPPLSRMVRDDGSETVTFWFQGTNAEGDRAMDVFRGMTKDGEELATRDPENRINYMRCALANRDELIALIRKAPRHVVVERNGRRVAIREDATADQRKQISDML